MAPTLPTLGTNNIYLTKKTWIKTVTNVINLKLNPKALLISSQPHHIKLIRDF